MNKEELLLTDEEIIGDFCKACDYSLEGCLEHGQQSTCASYKEALRQKKIVAKAQLAKVLPLIEQARQEGYETALAYIKGIESPCPACGGIGQRAYASTATWHGGIGGQMITNGICDRCWGSGDDNRHWINLRVLNSILTKEQKEKLYSVESLRAGKEVG